MTQKLVTILNFGFEPGDDSSEIICLIPQMDPKVFRMLSASDCGHLVRFATGNICPVIDEEADCFVFTFAGGSFLMWEDMVLHTDSDDNHLNLWTADMIPNSAWEIVCTLAELVHGGQTAAA